MLAQRFAQTTGTRAAGAIPKNLIKFAKRMETTSASEGAESNLFTRTDATKMMDKIATDSKAMDSKINELKELLTKRVPSQSTFDGNSSFAAAATVIFTTMSVASGVSVFLYTLTRDDIKELKTDINKRFDRLEAKLDRAFGLDQQVVTTTPQPTSNTTDTTGDQKKNSSSWSWPWSSSGKQATK
jgi:hypothetical protein